MMLRPAELVHGLGYRPAQAQRPWRQLLATVDAVLLSRHTWRVIVTDASTVHASTLALSGWLQPSAFSCRKSNLWEAAAGKTKLAMLEIRELKSATCRRSGAAFFIDNRVAYVHSSCSNDLLTLWLGGAEWLR